MSRIQMGQSAIYSNQLYGGGPKNDKFVHGLKTANQWAKDHKVISTTGDVLNRLGVGTPLNALTAGYYGRAVDTANHYGYGKKRRAPRKKAAKAKTHAGAGKKHRKTKK